MKYGNTKLGKDVLVFNLPRILTCKASPWCERFCYMDKAEKMYKNVRVSNDYCYVASRGDNFADIVIAEIKRKRKPIKYVRIHADGDFYSVEYIDKWITIAKTFPQIKFLAFTRRDDFKKAILRLNSLKNVIVYESLDPSKRHRDMPELLSARVIGKYEETPELTKTQFVCSRSCPECRFTCWKGKLEILFQEH